MPEATPFRVLIVDDHPLMRRGISQLLQLDPAFNVVAEAGDGASAIGNYQTYNLRGEKIKDQKPQLSLLLQVLTDEKRFIAN